METLETVPDFVGEIPEDLTCPICFDAIIYPQRLLCCNQLICLKCIQKWNNLRKKSCPLCRQDLECKADEEIGKLVGLLEVKCHFYGCEWLGLFKDTVKHYECCNGLKLHNTWTTKIKFHVITESFKPIPDTDRHWMMMVSTSPIQNTHWYHTLTSQNTSIPVESVTRMDTDRISFENNPVLEED